MRTHHTLALWVCLVSLAGLGTLFAPTALAQRAKPTMTTPAQHDALRSLRHRFGHVEARFDEQAGALRWLQGTLSQPLDTSANGLFGFLDKHRVLLGLTDPRAEFRLQLIRPDSHGGLHARFERVHRGVPAFGQMLTLHLNEHRVVMSVTADYLPRIETETAPRLSAIAVLKRLKQGAFAGQFNRFGGPPHQLTGSPELVVARTEGGLKLGWLLSVESLDAGTLEALIVSAEDGGVLRRWSLRVHAETQVTASGADGAGDIVEFAATLVEEEGNVYLRASPSFMDGNEVETTDFHNFPGWGQPQELVDILQGILDALLDPDGEGVSDDEIMMIYSFFVNSGYLDEEPALEDVVEVLEILLPELQAIAAVAPSAIFSSTGEFKHPAAVDAHSSAMEVLDYLWNEHAWKGWDNLGSKLNIRVHVGKNYNNATFGGGYLSLGDGDGLSLTQTAHCKDIMAHEIAHGVVEGAGGLVYANQSGALNEHISDTVANFIDPPKGPPVGPPEAASPMDWALGEDCAGIGLAAGYLRHYRLPRLGGQPDHIYDFAKVDYDHGGVHINSGIGNKVGSLITLALGIQKTSKLYFQLMKGAYLGQEATFSDYRDSLNSACSVLHPSPDPAGVSVQCGHVKAALFQVGFDAIGAQDVECPAGSTPDAEWGCDCDEGTLFNYATGTCTAPESGPCGSVSLNGECTGDVISFCKEGAVETIDCGAEGKTCVFAAEFGAYTCQALPSCDEISAGGQCAGPILTTCNDGILNTSDCKYSGQECVVVDGAASCQMPSVCTPSCEGKACGLDGCGGLCGTCGAGLLCNSDGQCEADPAADCGDIEFTGTCDGQLLKYCDNDVLVVLQCNAAQLCEFVDDKGWYDCVQQSQLEECGEVTAAGQCVGDVLHICAGGEGLETLDCTAQGKVCSVDDTNGQAACADPGECGDITFVGECTDGTVEWCANGELNVLDCASYSYACGWKEELSYYDCVPKQGDTCPNPLVISSVPFQWSGSTTEFLDWHETGGTCSTDENAGIGASDAAFLLVPDTTQEYVLRLLSNNGTPTPTTLTVVTDCEDIAGSCIANSGALASGDTFAVELTEGVSYYVLLDGWAEMDAGTVTLEVDVFCPDGCPDGEACHGGVCVAPGANCGNALEIDTMPFTYDGSTAGGTDAFTAPDDCVQGAGRGAGTPDTQFQFTPETSGYYHLSLTQPQSNSAPWMIAVVEGCATGSVSCIGNSGDLYPGGELSVMLDAGRTYFVVVDGWFESDIGDYGLSVVAGCQLTCDGVACGDDDGCGGTCGCTGDGQCHDSVCVAQSDSCSNPFAIHPLPFTYTGSLVDQSDSFAVPGACSENVTQGTGLPDTVFQLLPEQTGDHVFTLIQEEGDDPWTMTVVEGCAPDAVTCLTNSGDLVGGGELTVALTEGVPVFLVIDGWQTDTVGAFDLSVIKTCEPVCDGTTCGSDGCEGTCTCASVDDVCDASLCVSVGQGCINPASIDTIPFLYEGTTAGGLDTMSAPEDCGENAGGGAGFPDAVFQFVPAQTGTYGLSLTQEQGSAPWTITVVEGCAPDAVTCVGQSGDLFDGGELSVNLTAGTPYFVVVDGWQATDAGPFGLSVVLACASTCDGTTCGTDGCGGTCTCAGADDLCDGDLCVPVGGSCQNPLGIDALPFTFDGSTLGGTDAVMVPDDCADGVGAGAGAPDTVFHFAPTESGPYALSLTQSDPSTSPSTLTVTAGCGSDDATCVGHSGALGDGEAWIVMLDQGVSYYIAVDDVESGDGGPFGLSVVETCIPACDGTACGADGCDGECACSEDAVCLDGLCEALGDSCANPIIISTDPATITGDTTPLTDGLTVGADCMVSDQAVEGAPDAVYLVTPEEDGRFTFGLVLPDGQAKGPNTLMISDDCADIEASCMASVDQLGVGDTLTVDLAGGAEYALVVDGDTASAFGAYELLVGVGCAPQCDDAECGEDGCGGFCGACGDDAECDDGTCVEDQEPVVDAGATEPVADVGATEPVADVGPAEDIRPGDADVDAESDSGDSGDSGGGCHAADRDPGVPLGLAVLFSLGLLVLRRRGHIWVSGV